MANGELRRDAALIRELSPTPSDATKEVIPKGTELEFEGTEANVAAWLR